jgi:hypothetical protein
MSLLASIWPVTAQASGRRSDPVVISIDSVTPAAPAATSKPRPLSIELTVQNTTGKAIPHVRIQLQRGLPIQLNPDSSVPVDLQDLLDKALADPSPPTTSGLPIDPTAPITVDLPADGSVDVTFRTVTTTSNDIPGLCLCSPGGVYPLYLSAHATGTDGVDQLLGVATTYLPTFYAKPAPMQVGWLWPLIDRPHRLTGTTTFTDDDLAGVVSPDGGRLWKALAVVDQVGGTVPITLMVDPELLDELEIMASGAYTVGTGTHAVPGTGQAAATAWLGRLSGILNADPDVSVELTPYADPDIESLQQRGLHWSSTMPADMSGRVAQALSGRPLDSTVAWPASGAISPDTLQTLATDGVGTVVLNSTAVTPRTDDSRVPAGLARLQVNGSDVAAALTSAPIEKYAASAVSSGEAGAAALPALLSELAVQVMQEPDATHFVLITPPRYVDPDVTAARDTILRTSTSTFAQPSSLSAAVSGSLLPTVRSRLVKVPASAATLPSDVADTADKVAQWLPAITSLLDPKDPLARAVETELPIAVQRMESAAWNGQHAVDSDRSFAAQVSAQIDAITSGVQIVRPSSGSYTLASSNSPLPITVKNTLPYAVNVRIKIVTVNGLPGFTTKDIGVQAVDSDSTRTLRLPTKIDRSGRIKVEATLYTPNEKDERPLDQSVDLTVHSTALGLVGVIITIVAGVVLALALIVRFIRRLMMRRRKAGSRDKSGASPAVSAPAAIGDEPVTEAERAP